MGLGSHLPPGLCQGLLWVARQGNSCLALLSGTLQSSPQKSDTTGASSLWQHPSMAKFRKAGSEGGLEPGPALPLHQGPKSRAAAELVLQHSMKVPQVRASSKSSRGGAELGVC